MRKLIFTLLLILAAYVGYQYYFGKEDDKANAKAIVEETKDLGKAIGDMLRRQKDKYDDGEIDDLLVNVNRTLDKIKAEPASNEQEVKDHLRQLETELKQIDPSKLSEENRKVLDTILKEVQEELK